MMSEQNSPSEPTTGQPETKLQKMVSRNVAVALGIICIILIAGLGATMAYYTMQITSKDNQIASSTGAINQLNAKITNLTLELNQLQASLNETETLLNQSLTPSLAQGVYDGFQLTTTLEQPVCGLGNPINMLLTLSNISNQTVTFYLDYSFSYFQFSVYNSTMNMIYSSLNHGNLLLPLGSSYTLNAGESMSDSSSWQQNAYVYNNTVWTPESIPVLPGTYYIVGQVGPIAENKASTIETTPIQVTIV
jgi:hypothetical protein